MSGDRRTRRELNGVSDETRRERIVYRYPGTRREPRASASYTTRVAGDTTVGRQPTRRELSSDAPRVEPRRVPGPARIVLPAELAQRFTVIGQLGSGAEADVLLCRDREGEQVVLKWYRDGIELAADALDRRQEADPAHMVPLLEYGRVGTEWYEVQEHVVGGSLRELLDQHAPLDPEVCRMLVVELVDAIGHMHERGITHRDLKPSNILVRSHAPLDLVIADFGRSMLQDATAVLASLHVGTVGYQPPESLSGRTTSAYDLWPMGIIIHEALTGEHPLSNPDGSRMDRGQADDLLNYGHVPVDALADWPDLQHLVQGLLQRRPEDRFGVAEVRRWLAGELPPLPAPTPAVQSTPVAEPFEFDGKQYETPRELVEAFARSWRSAARAVAGAFLWRELATWLVAHGGARLAAVVDELGHGSVGPDRRLARLISTVVPDLPPVYRDVAVDQDGLQALTLAAINEDPEARAHVARLHVDRVLGEYTDADGCEGYEMLDRQWHDDGRHLEELLRPARESGDVPDFPAEDLTAARAHLLLARLDEDHAAQLQAAAERTVGVSETNLPWFPNPTPSDDPSRSVAVLMLMPIAERVRHEQEARAEERRLAREQEAAERRAERDERRRRRRRHAVGQLFRAAGWWWGCFLPLSFVTQLWAGSGFSEGQGGGITELVSWSTVFGIGAMVLVGKANAYLLGQDREPDVPTEADISSAVIGFLVAGVLAVVWFSLTGPSPGKWFIGPLGALIGLGVAVLPRWDD